MPLPHGTGERLAFIHVPKTAGTSFTTVLAEGWGRVRIVARNDELDAMDAEQIADYTLIAGHFFPHQIERPAFGDFVAVTVLRDPFARLISAWRFAKECVARGQKVGPAMAFGAKVSFSEFAFSTFGSYERNSQVYSLGRARGVTPQDEPIATVLARARQRLDEMLVGTADEVEPFARYLFGRFGRGEPPPMPRLNTTEAVADDLLGLSPARRAALVELMAPDFELLAHARGRMRALFGADSTACAT